MLDREIPLAVVEGETDGGGDGARPINIVAAPWAAIARSTAVSIPLPWTTAIAPDRAAATAPKVHADVRDSRLLTSPLILSRCLPTTMGRPAFLPSSTICFSWQKSRRLRASST